ncbi:hypothetical protein [Segetibacter koreensis]|uniref:hypothetical protein n=1 Tax=Segetibacter koreensis TaxID=398037 RepID=UPI0003A5E92A|nr:hypothetical protein [Segetibacter koreensis]
MRVLLSVLFLLLSFSINAQYAFNSTFLNNVTATPDSKYLQYALQSSSARKLYQHNTGMILGVERGLTSAIELGVEAHWRKISLLKPHIIGATANLAYDFSDHVIGYKAGLWMKRGRVNLTYGANVSYYNNFKKGSRFGIGPAVGFRLMGFHLINGYNFLTKYESIEKERALPVNSMYITLRYYFPVQNKFTWDRKTMKKKKERRKERAKRKKERENGDKKGFRKLFSFL